MKKSLKLFVVSFPFLLFLIVAFAVWREFGDIGLMVVFGLILLAILIGLTIWVASWWSERLILKGVQAAAGVQMANDRASAEMVKAFGSVTTSALKMRGLPPGASVDEPPSAISVFQIDPGQVGQIMPISGLSGNGRIIDGGGFDFSDDDGTKDEED